MRHAWLALAVVALTSLAGTADAQPITYPRPTELHGPERGSRVRPTEQPGLDLIATKPQAPLVDHVHIEVESQPTERMPVVWLRFMPQQVSSETAFFELAITDELGRQTITTQRDVTQLYRPELRVMQRRVRVEVRAIDAAGTRSVPTIVHVDVQGYRPYRCGLGPMISFVARAFAALMLVLLVFVVVCARRWREQQGESEAVSPLVADHIARAVLRRAASATVATVAGVVSALALDHRLVAVLIAFVAFVPLGTLLGARRVARELERERARAELRGTLLIVRSPDGQARVPASRSVIASARRHAVPPSIVR